MRRSRWNVSISSKTLRKPSGGSASSTRYGKFRSFARPAIALATSHLVQSSSASRFTAGAFEFFILSQSGERTERRVKNENPARAHCEPGILVVVTDNFLHEHRYPAPQGGIINSHERSDQP
jgi:hypothetical protein